MFIAELHQCALDLRLELIVPGNQLRTISLIRYRLIQMFGSAVSSSGVKRLVDGNSVNPAEKLVLSFIGFEVFESLEESCLCNICRILPVAQHPVGQPEERTVVVVYQRFQRLAISLKSSLNELAVPGPFHLLTHYLQPGPEKVGKNE